MKGSEQVAKMAGLLAGGGRVRGQSLSALPARAADELNNLEQELGGRRALVTALTYAPLGRDMRYLLGLLGDPEHEKLPLAECCRLGKVLPGQLIEALGKGTELRARLLATQLIARQTPAVVAEVMRKAAPYEDTCPHCQGLGSTTPEPSPEDPNPANVLCKACLGHGKLQYDAEGGARDLALEMAGLIGKGGGVQVQVTQQTLAVAGGGGAGAVLGFERMQEALDDLLYGAQDGLFGAAHGTQPEPESTPAADAPDAELVEDARDARDPQATRDSTGTGGPDGLGPVGGRPQPLGGPDA